MVRPGAPAHFPLLADQAATSILIPVAPAGDPMIRLTGNRPLPITAYSASAARPVPSAPPALYAFETAGVFQA
jgi:hypothetical protein